MQSTPHSIWTITVFSHVFMKLFETMRNSNENVRISHHLIWKLFLKKSPKSDILFFMRISHFLWHHENIRKEADWSNCSYYTSNKTIIIHWLTDNENKNESQLSESEKKSSMFGNFCLKKMSFFWIVLYK